MMKNPTIERYIDSLLEKSTPTRPVWNMEAIRQGKAPSWNYVDGCMIKAILDLYAITGDKRYAEFADAFIDYHVLEDGSIRNYRVDEFNLDNINAGKTLFELYDLTGKEKYRKAIDLIYTQVLTQPRNREGSFWHKLIYPTQIWLDGLYMCQPFYVEYETRFNDCKNYPDIFKQFATCARCLRDEKTGLYYHAYDSSRTMYWCDKETGLSRHFWIRALGWYTMALLDTMDKMDRERFPEDYKMMRGLFVDLIDSMLRFQDESGMWYQVVDQGGRERNYLETSGSSIMAYAIFKGIRLGFLPQSYYAAGEKAFLGICDRYLSDVNGELNLGGICLVAGLGGKTWRDGSYDYYMSEPVVENDAKGVAPFLLAYTELLRRDQAGL